jgi:Bacteriocin-protection, YdeI or OmpD-Associated/Domain of unknown function (DUF1905)
MAREFFEGTLERHAAGVVVALPFDPKTVFGRARAPVRATVNGHTFRTTLFTMGGRALVGLNREVRGAAGVEVGSTVAVELESDEEPRDVAVPPDLGGALADAPDAQAIFDRLSLTHRNEYVRWIEDAKRPETRARRAEKAIAMLRESRKTPERPN